MWDIIHTDGQRSKWLITIKYNDDNEYFLVSVVAATLSHYLCVMLFCVYLIFSCIRLVCLFVFSFSLHFTQLQFCGYAVLFCGLIVCLCEWLYFFQRSQFSWLIETSCQNQIRKRKHTHTNKHTKKPNWIHAKVFINFAIMGSYRKWAPSFDPQSLIQTYIYLLFLTFFIYHLSSVCYFSRSYCCFFFCAALEIHSFKPHSFPNRTLFVLISTTNHAHIQPRFWFKSFYCTVAPLQMTFGSQ